LCNFAFHGSFSDRLPPPCKIDTRRQIAALRNNSTVRRRVSTRRIIGKFFVLRYEFHVWKKILGNVITDRPLHIVGNRSGRVQSTVRHGGSCGGFG
jgi:hypothetical protein